MIKAYVKTFIGEFETQEKAHDFLVSQYYTFDEDTQPVFVDVGEKLNN